MGTTEPEHSLQPKLDEAHEKLEKALDEACIEDVKGVDTGELIRVEEALADAHKAAKEAVSVRLKKRKLRSGGAEDETADETADESRHRVFKDEKGKRWHAFAVHPSAATTERKSLPERYRTGWLAFESDDEMRRVAPIPDNWNALSIEEMRQLCAKAEVAPKRINAIDAANLPASKLKP